MKPTTRAPLRPLLALALALALAGAARAHMGLTPEEAVAGERTIVTLRIGHDCGDDTVGTTNFTVELPPMMQSVSVEASPNWRVLIHKAGEGTDDEYVRAVTYLGFLPDGFYQLFNVRMKMPETPGVKLWFKGYQDCHNQGTSIAWATIPDDDNPNPRYPARSITVLKYTDEDP